MAWSAQEVDLMMDNMKDQEIRETLLLMATENPEAFREAVDRVLKVTRSNGDIEDLRSKAAYARWWRGKLTVEAELRQRKGAAED
jgi:hypothetical protein